MSLRVYHGLSKLVSWIPGGLLQTNIAGCAIFAAISGSSVVTAASISRVALQELQRRKGFEIMNEVKSDEQSENELREQAALAQVLELLKDSPNKERREDPILGRGPTHNVLITLVRMLSKREREYFLELLKDDGIKNTQMP